MLNFAICYNKNSTNIVILLIGIEIIGTKEKRQNAKKQKRGVNMNEIDEIKQRINLLSYIQSVYDLGKQTKTSGGYLFKNCPMCNSHSSKASDPGHFFVNDSTNSYSSFSECCRGGSIIDFLMEYYNLDTKEAIIKAKDIAGIRSNNMNNTPTKTNKVQQQQQQQQNKQEEAKKEEQKKEFIKAQKKQFIIDGLEHQSPENKQKVYEYMASRGISKETADKYHLFISNNVYEDKSLGTEGTSRLIIPIYKDNEPVSYVARALTDVEARAKALNSAGEQTPLNIEYIFKSPSAEEDKTIYICEGWADALSFEDIGKKAIALHSTKKTKQFIEFVENHIVTASKYTYMLCYDNDEAGMKANQELADFFTDNKIKYHKLQIPTEYKDVNEWYINTGDKDIFKKLINPFNKLTTLEYIDTSFLNDIKRMKSFKGRSTGFNNLDREINGVIPGLYVIGAISSLGKTTFVTQIADQMASKGEHIIFFSLEQSRFELVAKSISRQTCIINPKEAKTSLEIMQNTEVSELTLKAVEQYQEIAYNSIIVEGNFNITVNSIREYIDLYITTTGIKPVVVLDYLQILRPISDRLTDKQQVDYNVTELKRISRDYDIPVFVICSFNRDNYTTTVDFTSFKESGTIEYSADVVIGLQLQVMEEIQEMKNPKISEIREKINNAKNDVPRRVQLIGLKNRNGRSYFKCNFKYYPAYNYFEEADIVPTYNNRVAPRRRNNNFDKEIDLPF